MPLIVLTASSMRLVIVVSISSALAPGRFACTETTGASVFGIRSRPSDSYDTAPSTMRAAVIMIAKTGRLTLISAMFMDVLHDGPGRVRRPPSPPRRTLTPVASWLKLVVASCSSPFNPLVTSTSLFWRAPSAICCWRALPFSMT